MINPQLIQDCKNGDRKAQFQLYKRCFSMLMGICKRYQKNDEDAAAALNLGFLRILTNLHQYRSDAPIEFWMRRIMINTLIDEFRKNRKVKELIEYTDFSQEQPSTESLDWKQAHKQFEAEDLERLIRKLPAISQKVFNLFAIDGYSHKEISTMLKMSEGTSKWHLSSARKRLREMMQEAVNSSKVI